MVFCSHCSYENPDEATQCETCSAPLPTKFTCHSCGVTVLSDANFCGKCGVKLRNSDGSNLNGEALALSSDVLSDHSGGTRNLDKEFAGSLEATDGGLDAMMLGFDSVSSGDTGTSPLDESFEMAVVGEDFEEGIIADSNLLENSIDADTDPVAPITEPLSDAEAQWLAEDDDDDDLDELELSWEAPPGPPPAVTSETFEDIEVTEDIEDLEEVGDSPEFGAADMDADTSTAAVDDFEAVPSPVTDLGDFDAIAAVVGTGQISENQKLEGMPGGMPPVEAAPDPASVDAGTTSELGDPWGDITAARPGEAPEGPVVSAEEESGEEPEAATVLQGHEKGQLLHLQTNTALPLPRERKVVHIGKTNSRVPPDIDVTDFPHAEIVSRVHADLHWDGSSYYLEDTGSANGTYVNSWPLPSHRRYQLREGDRITLGKHDLISFIFQIVS
ncbi:MAG: FHA domain-containing protein [Cyanobacteria bacterium P01_F01_bin.153]